MRGVDNPVPLGRALMFDVSVRRAMIGPQRKPALETATDARPAPEIVDAVLAGAEGWIRWLDVGR